TATYTASIHATVARGVIWSQLSRVRARRRTAITAAAGEANKMTRPATPNIGTTFAEASAVWDASRTLRTTPARVTAVTLAGVVLNVLDASQTADASAKVVPMFGVAGLVILFASPAAAVIAVLLLARTRLSCDQITPRATVAWILAVYVAV